MRAQGIPLADLNRFDGCLSSWSIGTRPTAELTNESLSRVCATLGASERPVLHSDRGAGYRWPGWIKICGRYGISRSMSRKASTPNNARMEGFFRTLKQEFFHHRDWSGVTVERFMEKLDAWLAYYNEERIKLSLGWKSPSQYRRALAWQPSAPKIPAASRCLTPIFF